MAKDKTAGTDQTSDPTKSAAFKDAVANAVAASIPAIREQILNSLAVARDGKDIGSAGTAADMLAGDQGFAEKLAMAISQLTDQGTGRKRVAPEIVRQRSEARELMVRLIIEARAAGEKPLYGLRNKVYLDEVLVDPVYITAAHEQKQTQITWMQVPNEAMVPLNDVAKGIFKAFMDSIGSVEKPAPEAPLGGVTAGGLTIRTGSKSVRPLAALGNMEEGSIHKPAPTDGGLNIAHRGAPGQFKETRILGTIAAPARQTS